MGKDEKLSVVFKRILSLDYEIPADVKITPECRDIIARMLVADPAARITIDKIYDHPWCAFGPSCHAHAFVCSSAALVTVYVWVSSDTSSRACWSITPRRASRLTKSTTAPAATRCS